MNRDRRDDLPYGFLDLVDDYCSDVIDRAGIERLEAILLASVEARRYFVAYVQNHTEIHFAVRAERAVSVVLDRLESEATMLGPRRSAWSARRRWLRVAWIGLAGLAAVVAVGVIGPWSLNNDDPITLMASSTRNIAWLVNAQDCIWNDASQSPGRDMDAGKVLSLSSGLAEIEFESGARVILQGPAGLRLLSGRLARLLRGSLTARVPARARGFTVLTPHNRVVDLGTEFGLSVDDAGAAMVRVFTGEVVAYPVAPESHEGAGVTIRQDQAARLVGPKVDGPRHPPEGQVDRYVRNIEPPTIIEPRTLILDFDRPIPATLLDADGRGIGLKYRLPGTGTGLPTLDRNIRLRSDQHALELTTTRSDINTQDRMATGEYLGVRLRDLGFTGAEDFEIRADLPRIPGLAVVGQFGLYAGTRSDRNIRGGLISRSQPDTYTLFLVNDRKGIDSDYYEVGLMNTGDDLRLALRRVSGRYSLVVDDQTRRSSSTLEIAHPAFLDGETDLHVGIFGANTQSDTPRTLTVRRLKVTVWTPMGPSRTIVQEADLKHRVPGSGMPH